MSVENNKGCGSILRTLFGGRNDLQFQQLGMSTEASLFVNPNNNDQKSLTDSETDSNVKPVDYRINIDDQSFDILGDTFTFSNLNHRNPNSDKDQMLKSIFTTDPDEAKVRYESDYGPIYSLPEEDSDWDDQE